MKKSDIIYTAPVIIEGGFEISNIKENGILYKKVRFLENLSDSMNYEQIQENDAKWSEEGNLRIASLPLVMSAAREGLRNGNNDFLNYLKKSFEKWPNFFSIVNYNPEGQKDRIIHYEGTPNEYSFDGNFVGPDQKIQNVKDTRTTYALTGIKGTSLLNKISNYVNGTEGHLWRINDKPSDVKKRIVRLGAYSDRLIFVAYRYPLDRRPVFRVEVKKE